MLILHKTPASMLPPRLNLQPLLSLKQLMMCSSSPKAVELPTSRYSTLNYPSPYHSSYSQKAQTLLLFLSFPHNFQTASYCTPSLAAHASSNNLLPLLRILFCTSSPHLLTNTLLHLVQPTSQQPNKPQSPCALNHAARTLSLDALSSSLAHTAAQRTNPSPPPPLFAQTAPAQRPANPFVPHQQPLRRNTNSLPCLTQLPRKPTTHRTAAQLLFAPNSPSCLAQQLPRNLEHIQRHPTSPLIPTHSQEPNPTPSPHLLSHAMYSSRSSNLLLLAL